MKDYIPHLNRSQEFQEIQKRISNWYKQPTIALMRHLIKAHGYQMKDLAPIVGISEAAIREHWIGPIGNILKEKD